MIVLIDTNVILDHLLDRKPFNEAAEWLFMQTEFNKIKSYIGATSVTTIYYLLSKATSESEAKRVVKYLLQLFEIAPVTRLVLDSAVSLKFPDFEDAVLYEAAKHASVDAIITRDQKGFQKSSLPVYSPLEFITALTKR